MRVAIVVLDHLVAQMIPLPNKHIISATRNKSTGIHITTTRL